MALIDSRPSSYGLALDQLWAAKNDVAQRLKTLEGKVDTDKSMQDILTQLENSVLSSSQKSALTGLGDCRLHFHKTSRGLITATVPVTYNAGTGIVALSYNSTNLKLTANELNTIQDIDSTASPEFTGLTLSGLTPNYLPKAGAGSTLTDSSVYDDGSTVKIIEGAITLGDGTNDVVLTFDGGDNDGVFSWMEDEDYFKFDDDIYVNASLTLPNLTQHYVTKVDASDALANSSIYDTGADIIATVTNDISFIAANDVNLISTVDVNLTATNDINLTATTDLNLDATNNLNMTSVGDTVITATAAKIVSSAITLGDGASDVVLTFDGGDNDGVFSWMEDEDYFKFDDDIYVNASLTLPNLTQHYITKVDASDALADSSIYDDGADITATVTNDISFTATNDVNLTATTDVNLNATNDINLTATTDLNLEATNNLNMTSVGDTVITATAAKIVSSAITLGDDASDVVLTFDGGTNDGTFSWMEDEDYFQFDNNVYVNAFVGIGEVPQTNISLYVKDDRTEESNVAASYLAVQRTTNAGSHVSAIGFKVEAQHWVDSGSASIYQSTKGFNCNVLARNVNALNQVVGIDMSFGKYSGAGSLTKAYGIVLRPLNTSGTTTTAVGIYINNIGSGGTVTTEWAIFSAWDAPVRLKGHIYIDADNRYLYLGAGRDATVGYDGTDMVINPQVVGAGNLKITTANISMEADNIGLILGGGKDCNIEYNGTNMVFNSQLVGAGDFIFDNGNIVISADNQKAIWGAGGDLEIYHDGTDNIIDCNTGVLKITGGVLETESGRIRNITRETGSTTLDATDDVVICDTDGGAITITLPAGVVGTRYSIENAGSSGNDVTVDGDGAETINGDLTQAVSDGESITIVFETTEKWRVI